MRSTQAGQSLPQSHIKLNDQAYAVDSVKYRIKRDPVMAFAIQALCLFLDVRPSAPNAPTGLVVNDDNTLDWAYFGEFTQPGEHFEVTPIPDAWTADRKPCHC